jgi:hypothetical protein
MVSGPGPLQPTVVAPEGHPFVDVKGPLIDHAAGDPVELIANAGVNSILRPDMQADGKPVPTQEELNVDLPAHVIEQAMEAKNNA